MHFVIKRKLPSLNEVIDANRENKYVGAKLKRELQEEIGWYIVSAVMRGDLAPRNERCTVSIRWHESTMRRDVDNIQSAQKFILDAMVKQGILKNDSRKYVSQVYHQIVDDEEDYVEVFVNDCKGSGEKTEESLLPEKGSGSKGNEVS